MDIDAFLKRTNLTKADLLRELGRYPKSSLISSYIAGRAFPPYDVCLKLVSLGITPRGCSGRRWTRSSGNTTDRRKGKAFRRSL